MKTTNKRDDILTALSYKLELDQDYRAEVDGEENDLADACLIELSDESYQNFADSVEKFENALKQESEDLQDYANNCNRTIPWELYLSLSSHGAGFWDHGTKEGDELQKLAEKVLGDYHFEGMMFFKNDGDDVLYIEG